MKWYQEWSQETNLQSLVLGISLLVPLDSSEMIRSLPVRNGVLLIRDTQWQYNEAAASSCDEASAVGAARTWVALDLHSSNDICKDL